MFIKYVVGNKFILEGDDVNLEREPDEKGDERNEWNTTVAHDPADRLTDGRWKGTIIQEKKTMKDIRWKGLYDKNSDMQYAPRQLMPLSHYEQHFERTENYRAQKFRKLIWSEKGGFIYLTCFKF